MPSTYTIGPKPSIEGVQSISSARMQGNSNYQSYSPNPRMQGPPVQTVIREVEEEDSDDEDIMNIGALRKKDTSVTASDETDRLVENKVADT